MSRLNIRCLSVVCLIAVAASAGCVTPAALPTPASGPIVERGTTQSEQDSDPVLREANAVRQLGELCDANLSHAAVAQSAATSAQVRAFATTVYEDNRALHGGLDRMSQQFGLIELRASGPAQVAAREEAFALTSRKGSVVDRTFLESVVRDQDQTIRMLHSLAESAERPELRALIEERFLQVARKNVAQAKEILASPAPDLSLALK